MNCKWFGSKRPWTNRGTIPACAWRLRKITETSVGMAGVPAEIWSHNLFNTEMKSLSLIKHHAMKTYGVGSGKLLLVLASPVVLGSGSRGTLDHIFLSHDYDSRTTTTLVWGSEGQVHLFLTLTLNGDWIASRSVALFSRKEFSFLMVGWVSPSVILDEKAREKVSSPTRNIPR
jgi:hypothetical protein